MAAPVPAAPAVAAPRATRGDVPDGLYGMRQGAAGGCGGIERYEARDVLASREVRLFFSGICFGA